MSTTTTMTSDPKGTDDMITRTFTLDDAEAAWEASRHDGCKDDGCRWDAFRTALLAAKPETAETPEQVCERLGIDVPKWAAEIRAKVAAAAKPAAKTCESWCGTTAPEDAEFWRISGGRDYCTEACDDARRPLNPAPAASPPAWLPLGQHPDGVCRAWCGTIDPNCRVGKRHPEVCYGSTEFNGNGISTPCFCSEYCYDRELAAEGRRLGREFGERTRAMTGPSAYVARDAFTQNEPVCQAGEPMSSSAPVVKQGGGQPGVPDGWRLGEGWMDKMTDDYVCMAPECLERAIFELSNNAFDDRGDDPGVWSTCYAHAKTHGAIVPAEPSRPVTGEADPGGLDVPKADDPAKPRKLCMKCGGTGNRMDGGKCKYCCWWQAEPIAPPAPGNHPGTPSQEALTVDCPECGAKAGQPCKVPKLSPIDRYHIPRFEAAREAPGKPDEAPVSEQIALMRWAFDPGDNRRADVAALSKKVAALEARLAAALAVAAERAHSIDMADRERAIRDARIAELTTWRAAAEAAAREFETRMDRAIADKAAAVLAERERVIDAEHQRYDAWAETRVSVPRAAEGEPVCGKQCPCGGDCIRAPHGDEDLHLCIGDDDNVPGTCPA